MMLENTTVLGTMMRSPPPCARSSGGHQRLRRDLPLRRHELVSDPKRSLDEDVNTVDETAADILKGEADTEGGGAEDSGDGSPAGATIARYGCAQGVDGESGARLSRIATSA